MELSSKLYRDLQRRYAKYFEPYGEGTILSIERQQMKRDLFWTGLLTRIAKQGAISYMDLKKLPVDEFFLLVMEYEKSVENG